MPQCPPVQPFPLSPALRDLPGGHHTGKDPGRRLLRRGVRGHLHQPGGCAVLPPSHPPPFFPGGSGVDLPPSLLAERGEGECGCEDVQEGLQPREQGQVPERGRYVIAMQSRMKKGSHTLCAVTGFPQIFWGKKSAGILCEGRWAPSVRKPTGTLLWTAGAPWLFLLLWLCLHVTELPLHPWWGWGCWRFPCGREPVTGSPHSADEEVGPPPHREAHWHCRGRTHVDHHGAVPLWGGAVG